MLTKIFVYSLGVSVWGGLLILLLWLLRPVTGRYFGVKWQYYSWLPVLLVLFLPLFFAVNIVFGTIFADFADKFSLPADITIRQAETELAVSGKAELIQVSNQIKPDYTIIHDGLSEYQISLKQKIYSGLAGWAFWPYLAGIWLAVAVLLLVARLLIYVCLRQNLAKNSVIVPWQSLPLSEREIAYWRQAAPKLQLRQQKTGALMPAPFVIGLRRSCLLLPPPALAAELSVTDWQNLLRHELTHYQRHDLFYKWLLLVCQCLHWFNPAVYLAGRQIEQDCEISCDLAVTGRMNETERRDYMRTILRMLTPTPLGSGGLHTGMGSDKGKIQRRFEMISKHNINGRRLRMLAMLVGTLLVSLALGGSALAAAQASNLELVAVAQTVDNEVAWGVSSNPDGIVVYNNGEAVNFKNKPYLSAEGQIYLPLREMLEQFRIIDANDNSSLQYENGLVKLELYQWLPDAAGGQVLHCFYQRQFSLTDGVGAQMHNDVIYVPAEVLLGIAQMSAAGDGSTMLDGLMIMQYDTKGGEILRLVSLPLPGENKTVNAILPLPERFAVATQFLQAWRQSDYQQMQSLCTPYVLESVGWQNADVMLGEAVAVYAEHYAAEPNSLMLHVLIIRPDGKSGYSELAVVLEVEQQTNGGWLIGGLRSSNRDDTPLSDNADLHWQWPLDAKYHILSQGFGGSRQHSGIDIPAPTGTPVYAAAAGLVQAAGFMGEDGNKVVLQHAAYGDWETRYSHLSGIAVQAGEEVQAGQVIGYVGSTGNSTGAHLHFAILQNGQVADPLEYLEDN